jgi:myo-inositol-1(or 4)-monophosphatase
MNEGELDARETALAAVAREAGELARKHFESGVSTKLKGKQDFITAADGEVERLIIERLKSRFPATPSSARKAPRERATPSG